MIAFTGYKWRDADDPTSGEISLEEGADNCVKGLKALAGHAEKKGVTICLEHLNTRDDTHPMKGHPGYQGDDVDYVAEHRPPGRLASGSRCCSTSTTCRS